MERPFAAYEGSEPFVFICYAHADSAEVYPEITRLKEAGFHIWYDEGISPGAEWSSTLAERIQACAVFLYFVTPRSVERDHCRREVNFALEQHCTILPVHLQPTEVPAGLQLNLSHRQAILRYEHARPAYEAKLDRALEAAAAGRPEVSEAFSTGELQIGDWILNPGTQRLRRGDEEHVLDPKDVSVLLHLVDAAPELVSVDDLMDRNWPGAVVGDNALHQVIARLRRAFGDDARSPAYIETLPRRGYRLMVPVEVMTPTRPETADGSSKPVIQRPSLFPGRMGLVAGAMVVLVGVFGWWWVTQPESSDSEADTRVAVGLEPVRVVTPDQELEAFASVIEIDLVNELSRTDLEVISRVTAGDPDYLVGISLRRFRDRVEVAMQVANTRDGSLVWSMERSTDELDRFVQAPLFAYLVKQAMLLDEVGEPTTPVAQREFVKGAMESLLFLSGAGGDYQVALRHLEAATAADPDFARAHRGLAFIYKNRVDMRIPHGKAVKKAHESINQVLKEHPDWTFALGAINASLDLDYKAAIANLEYAKANQSSYSDGEIEIEIGWALLWSGDIEGALERFDLARRMDPGVNRLGREAARVRAYLAKARYDDALLVYEELGTELDLSISTVPLLINQVRALKYSGQVAAANEALDRTWEQFGELRPELFPGVYALLGREEEAKRLVDESEFRFENGELGVMSETFWAAYYLGEEELAFRWLVRTINNREFWFLPAFRHSVQLDPIRKDSRFIAAMELLEEIEAAGTPIRSAAYP